MPAAQTDPWEDVAKEYKAGNSVPSLPENSDEDWKLFNPEGGGSSAATKGGFLQGLLENAPFQMHQWPKPEQKIPGVAETVGMAIPNLVLGGGELIRKLLSKNERSYGLGQLASTLASGGPQEYIPHPYIGEPRLPEIKELSPAARAWADLFGVKQAGYPTARALSTIHFSPGMEPPPILKSGLSDEPFGVFSREMPARPITINPNGPAARGTPGWQGLPQPSITPPPEFAGTPPPEPGVLPTGRKVGGPQNIGPVPVHPPTRPSGPSPVWKSSTTGATTAPEAASTKGITPPPDPLYDQVSIAQAGKKYAHLTQTQQDTVQRIVADINAKKAAAAEQPITLTKESATSTAETSNPTPGQAASQRLTMGKETAGDIHALQSQNKNFSFAQYLLDDQHYTPEQVQTGLSNSDIAQHFPAVSKIRMAKGEIKQPMKTPETAGKIGRDWPELRTQLADAMREIQAQRAGKNFYE